MLTIKIKTGNEAFRDEMVTDRKGNPVLDPTGREVRRLLKVIGEQIGDGRKDGKILDINGNHVGEWKYR